MHPGEIEQVRRFNRTVTQRVGALSDRFLARDRPLSEARMLWEIGSEGCEVRALRNRLELDSGHASRLLRALEADGLVCIEPTPSDRRVRMARLTRAGLAERAMLDERSDDLAASMLDPLEDGQRERLVDAMRTVERLLTRSAVEIRKTDPNHPDARQCVRAYFAELDRRSDSDLSSDDTLPTQPDELRPPAGQFLVAYLHGEPVGCGGVKHHADGVSELKRIWVSESARGLGLGRRILGELESLAGDHGAKRIRLDTNRNLVEAIAMYRSAGYCEIPAFNDEPFAHHWFEKRG
ncbi:MAG TPA: helix-turn-helix domain-containing GNAT family N-acetyltransferase [Candidatus Dormibacteraeota bacterium]|nr:helix-turn-helix domain-containing GNAT family N-acetyltransferase [Candidatus Dormibacteraeota bacterium]